MTREDGLLDLARVGRAADEDQLRPRSTMMKVSLRVPSRCGEARKSATSTTVNSGRKRRSSSAVGPMNRWRANNACHACVVRRARASDSLISARESVGHEHRFGRDR